MTSKDKTNLNAAHLISSAIIGEDFKVVLVAGKRYVIKPPTIKKIAGAAVHLSKLTTATEVNNMLTDEELMTAPTHALSWLIDGSDTLAEALQEGTPQEIANAIEAAYSLLSVEDFSKLSFLAKNVSRMTANTKQ